MRALRDFVVQGIGHEISAVPLARRRSRPPGPERGDPRYLPDYAATIFARNFIIGTKSPFVGGQLGGQFFTPHTNLQASGDPRMCRVVSMGEPNLLLVESPSAMATGHSHHSKLARMLWTAARSRARPRALHACEQCRDWLVDGTTTSRLCRHRGRGSGAGLGSESWVGRKQMDEMLLAKPTSFATRSARITFTPRPWRQTCPYRTVPRTKPPLRRRA